MIFSRGEIYVLSPRVGTEIDIHENRYYRIFPFEKGFINAQFIEYKPNEYRVKIVKEVMGAKVLRTATISTKKFRQLQDHVNSQKEITEEALEEMYKGMHFLQADKIINKIPKPQYVKVKYTDKHYLSGTLLDYVDEVLFIQTPFRIEKINLNQIKQISYRTNIENFVDYKAMFYIGSAAAGLALSEVYNRQRFPQKDVGWYNRFYGISLGLIFSGEIFDAFSTLLSSKSTFILDEEEYEKQRKQKL
ncbi:MAG: hypothetical protein CMG04_10830 [Candidatus Marinimicrobia bacterium]|nr:hypothetical protein [Candidatus Neomarinimicrobiota bacterium]